MSKLMFTQYSTLDKWYIEQYLRKTIKGRFPMVSLSKILKPIRVRVNSQDYNQDIPLVAKIRFSDGQIFYRVAQPKNDVFLANKGQLLVSNINFEKGAFCIVDKETVACSTDYQPYNIIYSDILPEYLNLCLRSDMFLKNVSEAKPKGMKTRAKWDFIKTFSIPVPSLSEQEQIVARYKNTIMDIESELLDECHIYNIVENFLTKELKIVRQEINSTGLFSTINYNEMDTWGVDFSQRVMLKSLSYPTKKLIRLCSIGSGGTPSRSHPEYYQGTTPWVKTGEILNDIIYDTEEKITQDAINNSSAKVYPVGSLIIAMYGQGMTRGRTAKLGVAATTNQACAVMHEFKEEIYPDYLWVYLMGEYNHIRPLASGNNQPNLSAEKIKNYPIILPPLEEQKRLAEEVFVLKGNLKIQRKEILCRIEKAKQDFENAIFGEQEK